MQAPNFRSAVLNFGFLGIEPHAFDAPQGAGLCGVALGRGDDFSVVGPEPEAELPRLVLKQLEFGVGNRSGGAGGQILQPSLGRIALHRGDTTQAGRSGEVDFGCGDDLPIACGQVKFDTGSHGPNDEFSHDVSPFSPSIPLVGESCKPRWKKTAQMPGQKKGLFSGVIKVVIASTAAPGQVRKHHSPTVWTIAKGEAMPLPVDQPYF